MNNLKVFLVSFFDSKGRLRKTRIRAVDEEIALREIEKSEDVIFFTEIEEITNKGGINVTKTNK